MNNRKYDLIGAGVFALILLLVLMFTPRALANETSQTKQLNDWFEKQYIEFITFQKQGWEDSKAQLALNKEQIINMPETITVGVSQTFNDISNLFVSAVDTLNISITGILNDK
jgi:cellobiose-specific phosphotransferase system component IIC